MHDWFISNFLCNAINHLSTFVCMVGFWSPNHKGQFTLSYTPPKSFWCYFKKMTYLKPCFKYVLRKIYAIFLWNCHQQIPILWTFLYLCAKLTLSLTCLIFETWPCAHEMPASRYHGKMALINRYVVLGIYISWREQMRILKYVAERPCFYLSLVKGFSFYWSYFSNLRLQVLSSTTFPFQIVLNFKQDMGLVQQKRQDSALLYVLLILGLSENRWINSGTA